MSNVELSSLKDRFPWYELVPADAPITQGDFIFKCPLVAWVAQEVPSHQATSSEGLKSLVDGVEADVVVMTQACDLEHNKVDNVILCPHVSVSEYKETWAADRKARFPQENSRDRQKQWMTHCKQIRNGFAWNLALLKSNNGEIALERRIVDFHEVFTCPRSFVESLLKQRAKRRTRLLPPYREHLSQAFARFFMRVGLPVAVADFP